MSEEFHKVRRLPPYVFEQVNRLKASARAAGADIIDLGMGNPDLPTPQNIVDKLCEAVQDPRAHRYSASKGIPGLRRAQAQYYARRFGVKLNPDTQVVATLGSKEGFANMAQAITAPGDVVLCPDPTYPIHSFGFIMSGGVIRSVQAKPDENFIPTLERGVKHSIPKPIALILNFPSNPTAYVATLDFYKDVVAFARKHDIVILSDRQVGPDRIPIPALLATAAVHHHLIRKGLRTSVGLVVESGEPREIHHFCCLAGYGAEAINPYLAFDTLLDMHRRREFPPEVDEDEVVKRYIKSIGKGMLKVMSKMGISTYQSYCGAQIFDAVGLQSSFVDKFFFGTATSIEGVGLDEIAEETVRRHRDAFGNDPVLLTALEVGGEYVVAGCGGKVTACGAYLQSGDLHRIYLHA